MKLHVWASDWGERAYVVTIPLDSRGAQFWRRYDCGMAGVVHISEEEAAKDFAAVMEHIRLGDEVRLECKDGVEAVVKRADTSKPMKARRINEIAGGLKERKGLAVLDGDFEAEALSPDRIPGKTIQEILESFSKWEAVHGPLIVDEGFAQDVAEAHERFNRPLDTSRWD